MCTNKAVSFDAHKGSMDNENFYHTLSAENTLKRLDTSEANGLDSSERERRLKLYGENLLPEAHGKGFFSVFFSQFADFMIFILFIAAGLSFYTSLLSGSPDLTEPLIILAILIINALIGTLQELKAAKSLNALKKCQSLAAWIISSGLSVQVDASSLVPGDIIRLNAGDIVPADARIISSVSLLADESALTGESMPSEKDAGYVCAPNTALAERHNMLFSSAIISSGHATAVVAATGSNTEIGKIAAILKSNETPETPLMQRMRRVSRVLGSTCLLICALIFAIGIYKNQGLMEMFMTGISLAVASIPEGLPAVVTIMLSIGVIRLAGRRCIVRNLSCVEALGNVDVICTDKTGTLTCNKMTVVAYSEGSAHKGISKLKADSPSSSNDCENSLYRLLMHTVPNCGRDFERCDATEKAILSLWKSIKKPESFRLPSNRLYEFAFNSDRKTMATVYLEGDTIKIYLKGAFDKIIPLCKLDISEKKSVNILHTGMTADALRVICVAYREFPYSDFKGLVGGSKISIENEERIYKAIIKEMSYIGLLGLLDPPRPEVKSSLFKAANAGIRTVMITGDHADTAAAIAFKIGIDSSNVITGSEIGLMNDDELFSAIKCCSVFARVSPAHKVRLVKVLQRSGHRVVMTGDGINDAPALKCADIGAAMGLNGTDVAKEAADIILTDDNYSTIVEAIAGGRSIRDCIRRSIHFLLSCNTGEVLTVLFALLFGLPTPLAAIQLLWINLITDSLPAIALGMGSKNENVMQYKERYLSDRDFDALTVFKIILEGALIAAISLIGYLCYGKTGCFIVLGMSELMHSFNLSSDESVFSVRSFNFFTFTAFALCSMLQLGILFVPRFVEIFELKALSFSSVLVLLGLSFVIILVSEIEKSILTQSEKSPTCK